MELIKFVFLCWLVYAPPTPDTAMAWQKILGEKVADIDK